jgi:hypothetical protein
MGNVENFIQVMPHKADDPETSWAENEYKAAYAATGPYTGENPPGTFIGEVIV